MSKKRSRQRMEADATQSEAARSNLSESPSVSQNRRRHVLVLLLAVSPFLASLLLSQGEVRLPVLSISERPVTLVFDEYLLSYGEYPIEPRPLLEPAFHFRNIGKFPVSIEELIPSCGCITPQLTKTEIPPGADGYIKLPIRTANEPPGPHEYSLTVRYRDTETRYADLSVKVVLPEQKVTVTPQALLVMGSSSTHQTHEISVSDMRDQPLNVIGASCTSPLIGVEPGAVRIQAAGRQIPLTVTFPEQLPPGRHHGVIQIDTDDDEYPQLFVPLMVTGSPRSADQKVEVSPPGGRLFVGRTNQEPFTVVVQMPENWSIDDVRTYPADMTATYQTATSPTDGRKGVVLQIQLPEIPLLETRHGMVTITANQGTDYITVPVQLVWP
ncbi:MAG: DUF1573 domain-containing protein [Planctomycetaceae bacterium]|nr:DUF1573 domain-containing protein [Planctomycetaceae bacterium]